ncbi:MAG: GNAT family N-acetyltransferase [Pseudomonadota bacterium]
MSEARITLRSVERSDRDEFLALMRASTRLHEPWIAPPRTGLAFDHYLRRVGRDDHEGFLLCLRESGRIVGTINLNNIVRGSFLSASLGYYIGADYAGQGYMREGLELLKEHAVSNLGLHRLEANIQADNAPSIALVKRSGFRHEGDSPAFLYINGAWRDHQRWVYVDERSSLLPPTPRWYQRKER